MQTSYLLDLESSFDTSHHLAKVILCLCTALAIMETKLKSSRFWNKSSTTSAMVSSLFPSRSLVTFFSTSAPLLRSCKHQLLLGQLAPLQLECLNHSLLSECSVLCPPYPNLLLSSLSSFGSFSLSTTSFSFDPSTSYFFLESFSFDSSFSSKVHAT